MKISSDKVYNKSTTNSLDLVFSGRYCSSSTKFCVGIEDSNLTQIQPVKAVLIIRIQILLKCPNIGICVHKQ